MLIIFIFLSISPFCIPIFRSVISPAALTYSCDESALRLFALCLCHRTTKHCFMRFKSLSFSLYAFLQFVNINRGVFLSPRHRMIFRRSVADLSVSVPTCGCSEKAVGFALSAIRWRTFSAIHLTVRRTIMLCGLFACCKPYCFAASNTVS